MLTVFMRVRSIILHRIKQFRRGKRNIRATAKRTTKAFILVCRQIHCEFMWVGLESQSTKIWNGYMIYEMTCFSCYQQSLYALLKTSDIQATNMCFRIFNAMMKAWSDWAAYFNSTPEKWMHCQCTNYVIMAAHSNDRDDLWSSRLLSSCRAVSRY